MGIDFKTKFDELYGGAEDIMASAPTLRDVTPGLIDGSSRFASKELNPRRSAVSARHFRNPRVRSREGAFERGGPVGSAAPRGFGFVQPSAPSGGGAVPVDSGGYAGTSGVGLSEGGDVGVPGGALGTEIGDAMAGAMGISGLESGLATAAGGLAMGASLGQIGSAALGSAVTGALNPISLALSLAPIAAQGISAHSAAQNIEGLTEAQQSQAAIEGFKTSPKNPLSAAWSMITGGPMSAGSIAADLGSVAAAVEAAPGEEAGTQTGITFGLSANEPTMSARQSQIQNIMRAKAPAAQGPVGTRSAPSLANPNAMIGTSPVSMVNMTLSEIEAAQAAAGVDAEGVSIGSGSSEGEGEGAEGLEAAQATPDQGPGGGASGMGGGSIGGAVGMGAPTGEIGEEGVVGAGAGPGVK
jgi:hypothetical protein